MSSSRPIGYWVKTVDRLIDDQFAAAAADAGLTRRQWQILSVLDEHPGATQQEVMRAVAPFLAPGETLGEHLVGIPDLVTVQPDGLMLTPTGRTRLHWVREHSVQRLRDRVGVGLNRDDYHTTLRTLERIAHNLGWSG